jgi:hypothetical protein
MVKSLRYMMLYAVLPRFAKIGFKYAQPFLISRTITFAASATDGDNIGWALVGAFGLVFGGLAVSTSVYKYICVRDSPVFSKEVVLIKRTLGTFHHQCPWYFGHHDLLEHFDAWDGCL